MREEGVNMLSSLTELKTEKKGQKSTCLSKLR